MSHPHGPVHAPIAIVGIGCRFQDIDDVTQLWDVLREGRCVVREVPPDRFDIDRYYDPTPGRQGRIVTREGGFIRDVWDFDNGLFRVSHREASSMDPQHRVLLEVSYQALVDAGVPVRAVSGRRGAVFIGMFTNDFRDRLLRHAGNDLDVYIEIGTTRSSAAGRISYAYDLTGPSSTVDAACASSLVAVHQACQAIWLGSAEFAIAGGCNLVLEPEATMCFSRSGMLSPDSRCKFGDSSANGFVRSDGAAMVVLKPLEAALRDGDRIYATILASGVSNDGKQGGGLYMTPSVEGQRALLQHVYGDNGLDPDDLVYLQAHGTGTSVGDPVETTAIAEALTGNRREPLWIGSIKTNLGHTEGAAGVAGLLEAALVLHHGVVPPSLHVTTPNPKIPWERGHLAIPTRPVEIVRSEDAIAGVSAFGLSGTNAHAVLGVAPASAPLPPPEAPELWLLPVSGHTPAALAARARDFGEVLRGASVQTVADVVHTAARRTSTLAHRRLVVGRSAADLERGLDAIAETPGEEVAGEGGVVFVFPGQGGQWPDMGRALASVSPAYRTALDEIDAAFRRVVGWSPADELRRPDPRWQERIDRVQPVLVAVQIAIASMWQALGVQPDAVVGHSMGEVSAAAVAEALSLDDAVRVICARSELMARVAGTGAMAVIGASEAELASILEPVADRVGVAVVNAAQSTVISGDPEVVDAIVEDFTAREIFARRVKVDVASHSPHVDPLTDELRSALADLDPRPGRVRMMSTVEADWVEGRHLRNSYWVRNLRHRVRFLDASRALSHAGLRRFLECGPHPVLAGALSATLRDLDLADTTSVVASMHRDDTSDETRRQTLATLYAAGVEVDVGRTQPPGRVVTLPPFPFQRETFHLPEEPEDAGVETPRGVRTTGHPWLTRPLRLASEPSVQVWQVTLSTRTTPWLADHRVRGSALLPGAAFVELSLATGRLAFERDVTVHEVELVDYLAVPTDAPILLQVQLRTTGPDAALLAFHSFDETGSLRMHARARVVTEASADDEVEDPAALLRERLEIEHARARRNPGHVYGLLQVALPTAGHDPDGARLPTHRIRRTLRSTDVVFGMGDDRVLIVASVSHPEQLQVVAQRLLGVLRGVGREHGWLEELRIRGCAVVAGDAPVEETLEHIDRGLPVMEVEIEARATDTISAGQHYDGMNARGIQYGPTFRPVRTIHHGGGVASAELVLPDDIVAELGRQPTHPAFLDGCFQAAVASFLAECDERDGFLPVGLQRLRTFHPPTERLVCHAWNRGRPRGRDDELLIDFIVLDDTQRPVLAVDGLRVRRFAHQTVEPLDVRIGRWMYRWAWTPYASSAATEHAAGPWLVVGRAPALAAALSARTLDDPGAVAAAFDGLAPGPVGVAFVAPSDPDDPSAASLALLEVMRGIARRGRPDPVRLWVITEHAWPVSRREACVPANAAVWGLVRVLANEAAELSPRLVDVDDLDSPRLAELVRLANAPDELAVRDGEAWQRRLLPGRPPTTLAEGREMGADEAATVLVDPVDHSLVTRRSALPDPGADDVVVRVEAVTWARIAPSRELVGVVGRVRTEGGESGGRVLAALPTASSPDEPRQIGRDVVVPARRVVPLPTGLDGSFASGLAAHWWAAMTATRGLSAGDRLFVANADAPVAQAAAWLATQRGAIVVASASALAARAALRAAGIDFVVDAASASLVSIALDLSGGPFDRMIDLAGALPTRMVEVLLRPDAKLVCGDEPRGRSAGLKVVRLLQATDEDAGGQNAALRTLVHGPHALPVLWGQVDVLGPGATGGSTWPSSTLELGRVPLITHDAAGGAPTFDARGVYLITGGTGGLGLRLAAWLGRRGAGHVLLTSRSARVRPDDALAFEAISATGVEVHVMAADIAERGAVDAVVRRAQQIGPIRGVFHLAGVLRDATWPQLDAASFRAVMAPKVDGAWNLHHATLDLPLDHFVLFSSAAATIGSPGQGNYAAANAALDAIAHLRRSQGLPAISIDWGSWNETGLAAAEKIRGERLGQKGMIAMAPAEALEAMGEALAMPDLPELTIADIDWAAWSRSQPGVRDRVSLRDLVPDAPEIDDESPTLDGVPEERRVAVASTIVRKVVSDVTMLPVARLGDQTKLATLGLDSLMAVELRAGLHQHFGVELSPRRLLTMESLAALTAVVVEEWVQRHQSAPVERSPAHDGVLDPSIRPTESVPRGSRGVLLLTGATGFVGAHVLRDLLDRTSYDVVCLVRGASRDEATARLAETMELYGLSRPSDKARVEILLGDLTQPRLGLRPDAFRALGERIEAIHHCGAWVNHVYDYATLASSNVDGTVELLRLSVTGGTKPLHHVSTYVVFPFTTDLQRAEALHEETPLTARCEPFFGGYAQTKHVAERLCVQASQRGLPVSIYRLGQITGSRDAALSPANDAIWRIVHAVAAMGRVPAFDSGFSLTPVDYVSRAIVHLSTDPETPPGIHHLFSDESLGVVDLADALHRVGIDVLEMDRHAWMAALVEKVDRGWPVAPLVPRLSQLDLDALDTSTIALSCEATLQRLPPGIRSLRSVDGVLLTAYLKRLLDDGHLPPQREIQATPVLPLGAERRTS